MLEEEGIERKNIIGSITLKENDEEGGRTIVKQDFFWNRKKNPLRKRERERKG